MLDTPMTLPAVKSPGHGYRHTPTDVPMVNLVSTHSTIQTTPKSNLKGNTVRQTLGQTGQTHPLFQPHTHALYTKLKASPSFTSHITCQTIPISRTRSEQVLWHTACHTHPPLPGAENPRQRNNTLQRSKKRGMYVAVSTTTMRSRSV